MGRVRYATRNIVFGLAGNVVTMLLRFALRYVFIMKLGDTLTGVEGLYTDILTMLSLAELGIGTAVNYSLYGPAARGEKEKIKSYMQLYKKAYRGIALVIAAVGLMLVPFLPVIVGDPGYITMGQLRVYYLIYLFNTVSTYFVAWKYSLANAEQKNYIQTNAITITKMVTVLFQMAGLFLLPNFLLYLVIQAAVELAQKIFVSRYLDRKYPLLKEKDVRPLKKEEKDDVMGTVGIASEISNRAKTSALDMWYFVAFLSINLSIMNLLPIPGLDGGKILFLLIEAMIRRPVPPKFEGAVQLAGLALIFGLFIFVTYNDIVRLIAG